MLTMIVSFIGGIALGVIGLRLLRFWEAHGPIGRGSDEIPRHHS